MSNLKNKEQPSKQQRKLQPLKITDFMNANSMTQPPQVYVDKTALHTTTAQRPNAFHFTKPLSPTNTTVGTPAGPSVGSPANTTVGTPADTPVSSSVNASAIAASTPETFQDKEPAAGPALAQPQHQPDLPHAPDHLKKPSVGHTAQATQSEHEAELVSTNGKSTKAVELGDKEEGHTPDRTSTNAGVNATAAQDAPAATGTTKHAAGTVATKKAGAAPVPKQEA